MKYFKYLQIYIGQIYQVNSRIPSRLWVQQYMHMYYTVYAQSNYDHLCITCSVEIIVFPDLYQ